MADFQLFMSKKNKKLSECRWVLKEPPYIKKTDKRYKGFKKQIKEKGFCDAETWGLDSTIAEFILPRLRRFRQILAGYPGNLTSHEWEVILDDMIFAFDWSLNNEENKYDKLTDYEKEENWRRYETGMNRFAEYFRHLWW